MENLVLNGTFTFNSLSLVIIWAWSLRNRLMSDEKTQNLCWVRMSLMKRHHWSNAPLSPSMLTKGENPAESRYLVSSLYLPFHSPHTSQFGKLPTWYKPPQSHGSARSFTYIARNCHAKSEAWRSWLACALLGTWTIFQTTVLKISTGWL